MHIKYGFTGKYDVRFWNGVKIPDNTLFCKFADFILTRHYIRLFSEVKKNNYTERIRTYFVDRKLESEETLLFISFEVYYI